MNLPRDVDDYFKQTLDDTLGIPVSSRTLESKLRASQESQWRLREHLLSLFPQLKRKDQLIDRFKVSRLFKIFLSQFLFLILEVDVEIFGYGVFFWSSMKRNECVSSEEVRWGESAETGDGVWEIVGSLLVVGEWLRPVG